MLSDITDQPRFEVVLDRQQERHLQHRGKYGLCIHLREEIPNSKSCDNGDDWLLPEHRLNRTARPPVSIQSPLPLLRSSGKDGLGILHPPEQKSNAPYNHGDQRNGHYFEEGVEQTQHCCSPRKKGQLHYSSEQLAFFAFESFVSLVVSSLVLS